MDNISLVIISTASAIGGALISSLIGPYITQSKDRRNARANVIRSLTDVEKLRWGKNQYQELNSAIAELKSAGLIALADRQLIEYYSSLALTSYHSAREDIVEGEEKMWLIPLALGKHIDDTLESLSLTLWHPWRTKLRRNAMLRVLKQKEFEIRTSKDKDIKWLQ